MAKGMTLDEMKAVWEAAETMPPEDAERLGRKMQSQADLNAALRAAGYESLEDLPHESDDDFVPVDHAPRQGARRGSRVKRGSGD